MQNGLTEEKVQETPPIPSIAPTGIHSYHDIMQFLLEHGKKSKLSEAVTKLLKRLNILLCVTSTSEEKSLNNFQPTYLKKLSEEKEEIIRDIQTIGKFSLRVLCGEATANAPKHEKFLEINRRYARKRKDLLQCFIEDAHQTIPGYHYNAGSMVHILNFYLHVVYGDKALSKENQRYNETFMRLIILLAVLEDLGAIDNIFCLHQAAKRLDLNMLKFFIELDADPNKLDFKGYCPLDYTTGLTPLACQIRSDNQYLRATQCLLTAGADPYRFVPMRMRYTQAPNTKGRRTPMIFNFLCIKQENIHRSKVILRLLLRKLFLHKKDAYIHNELRTICESRGDKHLLSVLESHAFPESQPETKTEKTDENIETECKTKAKENPTTKLTLNKGKAPYSARKKPKRKQATHPHASQAMQSPPIIIPVETGFSPIPSLPGDSRSCPRSPVSLATPNATLEEIPTASVTPSSQHKMASVEFPTEQYDSITAASPLPKNNQTLSLQSGCISTTTSLVSQAPACEPQSLIEDTTKNSIVRKQSSKPDQLLQKPYQSTLKKRSQPSSNKQGNSPKRGKKFKTGNPETTTPTGATTKQGVANKSAKNTKGNKNKITKPALLKTQQTASPRPKKNNKKAKRKINKTALQKTQQTTPHQPKRNNKKAKHKITKPTPPKAQQAKSTQQKKDTEAAKHKVASPTASSIKRAVSPQLGDATKVAESAETTIQQAESPQATRNTESDKPDITNHKTINNQVVPPQLEHADKSAEYETANPEIIANKHVVSSQLGSSQKVDQYTTPTIQQAESPQSTRSTKTDKSKVTNATTTSNQVFLPQLEKTNKAVEYEATNRALPLSQKLTNTIPAQALCKSVETLPDLNASQASVSTIAHSSTSFITNTYTPPNQGRSKFFPRHHGYSKPSHRHNGYTNFRHTSPHLSRSNTPQYRPPSQTQQSFFRPHYSSRGKTNFHRKFRPRPYHIAEPHKWRYREKNHQDASIATTSEIASAQQKPNQVQPQAFNTRNIPQSTTETTLQKSPEPAQPNETNPKSLRVEAQANLPTASATDALTPDHEASRPPNQVKLSALAPPFSNLKSNTDCKTVVRGLPGYNGLPPNTSPSVQNQSQPPTSLLSTLQHPPVATGKDVCSVPSSSSNTTQIQTTQTLQQGQLATTQKNQPIPKQTLQGATHTNNTTLKEQSAPTEIPTLRQYDNTLANISTSTSLNTVANNPKPLLQQSQIPTNANVSTGLPSSSGTKQSNATIPQQQKQPAAMQKNQPIPKQTLQGATHTNNTTLKEQSAPTEIPTLRQYDNTLANISTSTSLNTVANNPKPLLQQSQIPTNANVSTGLPSSSGTKQSNATIPQQQKQPAAMQKNQPIPKQIFQRSTGTSNATITNQLLSTSVAPLIANTSASTSLSAMANSFQPLLQQPQVSTNINAFSGFPASLNTSQFQTIQALQRNQLATTQGTQSTSNQILQGGTHTNDTTITNQLLPTSITPLIANASTSTGLNAMANNFQYLLQQPQAPTNISAFSGRSSSCNTRPSEATPIQQPATIQGNQPPANQTVQKNTCTNDMTITNQALYNSATPLFQHHNTIANTSANTDFNAMANNFQYLLQQPQVPTNISAFSGRSNLSNTKPSEATSLQQQQLASQIVQKNTCTNDMAITNQALYNGVTPLFQHHNTIANTSANTDFNAMANNFQYLLQQPQVPTNISAFSGRSSSCNTRPSEATPIQQPATIQGNQPPANQTVQKNTCTNDMAITNQALYNSATPLFQHHNTIANTSANTDFNAMANNFQYLLQQPQVPTNISAFSGHSSSCNTRPSEATPIQQPATIQGNQPPANQTVQKNTCTNDMTITNQALYNSATPLFQHHNTIANTSANTDFNAMANNFQPPLQQSQVPTNINAFSGLSSSFNTKQSKASEAPQQNRLAAIQENQPLSKKITQGNTCTEAMAVTNQALLNSVQTLFQNNNTIASNTQLPLQQPQAPTGINAFAETPNSLNIAQTQTTQSLQQGQVSAAQAVAQIQQPPSNQMHQAFAHATASTAMNTIKPIFPLVQHSNATSNYTSSNTDHCAVAANFQTLGQRPQQKTPNHTMIKPEIAPRALQLDQITLQHAQQLYQAIHRRLVLLQALSQYEHVLPLLPKSGYAFAYPYEYDIVTVNSLSAAYTYLANLLQAARLPDSSLNHHLPEQFIIDQAHLRLLNSLSATLDDFLQNIKLTLQQRHGLDTPEALSQATQQAIKQSKQASPFHSNSLPLAKAYIIVGMLLACLQDWQAPQHQQAYKNPFCLAIELADLGFLELLVR